MLAKSCNVNRTIVLDDRKQAIITFLKSPTGRLWNSLSNAERLQLGQAKVIDLENFDFVCPIEKTKLKIYGTVYMAKLPSGFIVCDDIVIAGQEKRLVLYFASKQEARRGFAIICSTIEFLRLAGNSFEENMKKSTPFKVM